MRSPPGGEATLSPHRTPREGPRWWAPRARDWQIAVLFAIGSVLFALGALPAWSDAVGARGDTVTYFVGSLFFTSAAFLCYREAGSPASSRLDRWATGIQLVGTLYFNVSTGVATARNLSAEAAHQHVWRPDAIGSVCFLLASALAWYAVSHTWLPWHPRSRPWWTALVNLLGSLAFGVSAAAGYVNPVTGEVRDLTRANATTLAGALCFLAGAVLLLPVRPQAPAGSRRSRPRTTP